ncbi:MAG: hydrogenase 4 subunit F [Rhodospirillaceae bacterium]
MSGLFGSGFTGNSALALLLGAPLLGGLLTALLPGRRTAAPLTVLSSLLSLLAACILLQDRPTPGLFLQVDEFSTVMIALISFVAFTSSLYSAGYIGHEWSAGRIDIHRSRLYHTMYHGLIFALNLGLSANNIGLMWVAIELATLTAVLIVGLYRTPEALEAAWKYFILGSVGVALALFGTILVYFAAADVVGEGLEAMAWTVLVARAAEFDPTLLNPAFIFLLLGYGTKAGLVPLHAWLPDAHAEGPTPITAVLSGLLINVSLYVILRFKMVLAVNPHVLPPGPLMIGLGLLSVLFASLMLYRRRDIKRLFAYSSIEHMGLCAFAFGIGGPLANFAGLLHIAMHSLTKAAIFFAVGHAVQIKGTQQVSGIRGLSESHPALGWGLAAGVLAIAGLPPFGVFTSEFLLISASFARAPLPTFLLILGLLLALGAMLLRLNDVVFGSPEDEGPARTGTLSFGYMAPLVLHLSPVLVAGIYLPPPLVAWLRHVAELLG